MHLTVRNYHLDGYGHVNHARYLEFCEEARWAFFDHRDWLELLGNIRLVVVRADVQYRRPALEGQTLHIATTLHDVQARALIVRQTLTLAHSGKTAVEADITLMPVDAQGKAVRLNETLMAALRQQAAAEEAV